MRHSENTDIYHFLHLSDLHFANHLLPDVRENLYMASLQQRGLVTQVADTSLLAPMKDAIEYYVTNHNLTQLDGVFLTGDICSAPEEPGSFDLPYDFLTQPQFAGAPVGLNFDPRLILAIPGNHDRMLEVGMHKYDNSKFKSIKPINRHGDYVASIRRGARNREILVYGLNTNYIDALVPAAGRISVRQVTDMLRIISDLADPSSARSAEGFSIRYGGDEVELDETAARLSLGFHQTFKVLPMHHHPTTTIYRQKAFGGRGVLERFGHMVMGMDIVEDQGYRQFSRLIEKRPFDLILHGHLHRPAIYRFHNSLVVAAGSALERNEPKLQQSFNILKICYWPDPMVSISTYTYKKDNGTRNFVPSGWKLGKASLTRAPQYEKTAEVASCNIPTTSTFVKGYVLTVLENALKPLKRRFGVEELD